MDWFDFIIARYNYWVVIILMMTGLYIVYARGNLVKKVVGLNVFQTSVFIFYITIGKIAGGTAPIYIGGELDHGDEKGHGAGGDHGADGDVSVHDAPAGDGHSENAPLDGAALDGADETESLHAKIDNAFPDVEPNDLKAALNEMDPNTAGDQTGAAESLHDAPGALADKISNEALSTVEPPQPGFELESADGLHDAETTNAVIDVAHGAGEIIYTNPLPHVLILTAIVVGVATTAVGLALAVRIREAYGAIEEDDLEAMDNIAEFGADAPVASGEATS